MVFKIHGKHSNTEVVKALVAAKFAGLVLEVEEAAGKVVLETDQGHVSEANAIVRHIARVGGNHLYGRSDYEHTLVDQWIEFAATAIDLPAAAWTLPIEGIIPNNGLATKKAGEDIKKVFGILDSHLLTRTYLVGNRVSIADIVVATSLIRLFELVLDPTFRSSFVNATRWFTTIVNNSNFLAVRPAVALAETVAVAPKKEKEEKPKQEKPAKQEKPPKQEKPKKEETPAEAEEEEEEGEKEEKKKNPLDDLPKSAFILDEWKRKYSNTDTRTEALPWFHEHFDHAGYSVFWTSYKYNNELNGPVYMVSNLIGGLFQRLEKLHKYGFGTVNIYGDTDGWQIHGVWVFRGPGIPADMTECDDSEVYDFFPADIKEASQKEKFDNMLCWEGEVGGKPFNSGKVYK